MSQTLEILTRVDVAYGQALTASVVGTREDLPETDRADLDRALDLLKGILDRHNFSS